MSHSMASRHRHSLKCLLGWRRSNAGWPTPPYRLYRFEWREWNGARLEAVGGDLSSALFVRGARWRLSRGRSANSKRIDQRAARSDGASARRTSTDEPRPRQQVSGARAGAASLSPGKERHDRDRLLRQPRRAFDHECACRRGMQRAETDLGRGLQGFGACARSRRLQRPRVDQG